MIIKVCGMREPENIRAVEGLQVSDPQSTKKQGVNWMGFIFCPKSPRNVSEVPSYLPSLCKRVGVFVNAGLPEILHKVQTFRLDIVQLHGMESPDFVRSLRTSLPSSVQIMKMLPVATADDLMQTEAYETLVDFFLFETKALQQGAYYGGSGQQFDWSLLSHYTGRTPFLLTGGIGPDDAEHIRSFRHPQFAGIDLNSKFEKSPALKDVSVLSQFISNLNS